MLPVPCLVSYLLLLSCHRVFVRLGAGCSGSSVPETEQTRTRRAAQETSQCHQEEEQSSANQVWHHKK